MEITSLRMDVGVRKMEDYSKVYDMIMEEQTLRVKCVVIELVRKYEYIQRTSVQC